MRIPDISDYTNWRYVIYGAKVSMIIGTPPTSCVSEVYITN